MHLKKALEILMLDLCNADLKIIIYYLAKNSGFRWMTDRHY